MRICFPQYDHPNPEDRLVSTLRMYSCREHEGQSIRMPVSSLVIFGDVGKEDFSRLCEQFAQRLRLDKDLSKIPKILEYRHSLLQRPRAQMFSCVLSIMNFARYGNANAIKTGEDAISLFFEQGDMWKIISNFGRIKELKQEFKDLIRWAFSTGDDVLAGLYQETRIVAGPLGIFQGEVPTPKQGRQINDVAEKIFYDAGMWGFPHL